MSLQTLSAEHRVKFNGGVIPTAECLSVDRQFGGSKMDQALVEVPFSALGRDKNLDATFDFNRQDDFTIEVEILREGFWSQIHWGKLTDESTVTGKRGPAVQTTSTLLPHHFGVPLVEHPVKVPGAETAFVTVGKDLVFNEEIDGQIFPNRSIVRLPLSPGSNPSLFQDPESIRTPQARQLQGVLGAASWTLSEAAFFLLSWLNQEPRLIGNPSLTELEIILGTDPNILANHKQPFGKHLPRQLDALLNPYGFTWFVDILDAGPRIRIVNRLQGTGQKITLSMQAPGERLEAAKSQLLGLDIRFNRSSVKNRSSVYGDFPIVEGTFELVRAWPEKYDDTNEFNLSLSETNDFFVTNPDAVRAWRDWTLNEAGDYRGTRPGIFGPPRGLNIILGPHVIKRRKFLPTITTELDGSPIGGTKGVEVEWWNPDIEEWRGLEELENGGTFEILQRECGIRFNAQEIPLQLYDLGADARIRITASLQRDRRLAGFAVAIEESLIATRSDLIVDVSSRYKQRLVSTFGEFESKYNDPQNPNSAVNNQAAIDDLASTLLRSAERAQFSGSVPVRQMNLDIELGQQVLGVTGLDLNFQTTAPQNVFQRFPLVAGLRYDFNEQVLSVSLDTPRGEGLT